jgi:hypothetical protein
MVKCCCFVLYKRTFHPLSILGRGRKVTYKVILRPRPRGHTTSPVLEIRKPHE